MFLRTRLTTTLSSRCLCAGTSTGSRYLASRRHHEEYASSQICRLSTTPTEAKERVPVKFLALNNLYDNPGAVKKYRRVGRGIGSSKGKTSGRGQKGQKARGKVHPRFEGGQTPLYKRLPKRGFKSKNKELAALNLGTLQDYVDMGRLPGIGDSEDNAIHLYHLVEAGIIKGNTTLSRGGVKLLADGKERLSSALHIEIGRASKAAIESVEAMGGTVTTYHYNERALRQLLRGPEHIKDRRARPPPKYQAYYTKWENRGYLHPYIQLQKWFRNYGQGLDSKFNAIRNRQEDARTKATNEDSSTG